MKQIERLSLIDRIGRELQARMTYSDIDIYLDGFGIDTTKQTTGVNSKWVYVKDLLSDALPDVILRIADELEIPHRYTVKPTLDVAHVADELFETLISSPRTRLRLLSCLVNTTVTAPSEAVALQRLEVLSKIPDVPRTYAEQFRDGIAQSSLIDESSILRGRVNEFLQSHELSILPEPGAEYTVDLSDDDIPF